MLPAGQQAEPGRARRIWLRKKGLVKLIRAMFHEGPERPIVVLLPPEEHPELREQTSRSSMDLVEAVTGSVSGPGEQEEDERSVRGIPRESIAVIPPCESAGDALGQIGICLSRPGRQVILYQGDHCRQVGLALLEGQVPGRLLLMDVRYEVEEVERDSIPSGKLSCVSVGVREMPPGIS